jgi:hypothetical protein
MLSRLRDSVTAPRLRLMHPPTVYLVYDGERVSAGRVGGKMRLATDENF